MRYVFMPEFSTTQAGSGGRGDPSVNMVAGGEYEVSDERKARLLAIVRGVDGGPCLVPASKGKAASDDPAPAAKGKPGPKPKVTAETANPGTETT